MDDRNKSVVCRVCGKKIDMRHHRYQLLPVIMGEIDRKTGRLIDSPQSVYEHVGECPKEKESNGLHRSSAVASTRPAADAAQVCAEVHSDRRERSRMAR